MIFKYNEKVDVKELCDLRQAVGWNRMEKKKSRAFTNLRFLKKEIISAESVCTLTMKEKRASLA